MVFLLQLPMVLLQERMKRKERYLSHLFQRMEKKFPFKCLLECLCWKQLMKMI
ncbi:hypothetical protein Gotri_005611 [Gossypium trilobum]|uniref:Uncharacterized protein n=1 Tax=Gossypium trilobum TaxID=34281 RepID=A0A7J9EX53_9ROSI|nr:hypothetical protein [Gossypium trilobum]